MNTRWKPHTTVAAVIDRMEDGVRRFLLVEEHTSEGLRLNNPAGHLDPGESLVDGCTRETLEETGHAFTPTALVAIYLATFQRPNREVTYMRYTFCGELGAHDAARALDDGIVRTVWMTRDEIAACPARHRSHLVLRSIDDYLRGQRFGLDLLVTDASVFPLTRA